MTDNIPAGAGDEAAEERDRRRTILLWILLAAAIALLLVMFGLCSGGGSEPASLPPASSTTTAPEPATTSPPTTLPAPTTTRAPTTAPVTTEAAPSTTAEPTTTTEAGPIDVSGTWSFIVDVTTATGACEGEDDETPDPEQVVIVQDGTTLTVTGLNGEDPPWKGEIDGNTVTFSGERNEDAGRTTASFTLIVDDAATMFTGTEDWNWSGPGGSCPGSASEVTAQRG